MKNLAVIFIFLSISITASAENFFPEADIVELQINRILPEEGSVIMGDRAGNNHEVRLGDTVGTEQAEVIEIEKAAVVIDRGDYETRIPAVISVGKFPKRQDTR